MKRRGRMRGLMACVLTACLLTACSVGDDKLDKQLSVNDMVVGAYGAVFDGEWTVNKQVVDTARLEVLDVLKVRLPEEYLVACCYPDKGESGTQPNSSVEYEGQPAMIPYINQGYTSNVTFAYLSADKSGTNGMDSNDGANGIGLFNSASFTVTIDGVEYYIALLSEEMGTALYINDTGLWTIGIPISSFHIVNKETNERKVHTLPTPITIYYNAKKRIR